MSQDGDAKCLPLAALESVTAIGALNDWKPPPGDAPVSVWTGMRWRLNFKSSDTLEVPFARSQHPDRAAKAYELVQRLLGDLDSR